MTAVTRGIHRITALGIVLSFAACAHYKTAVIPPGGAFYTHLKAPLTVDFHGNATGPATAKASQSATKFLGIPLIGGGLLSASWDDAAIAKIATDAGMSSVSYADYELLNILGVWQTFTVSVYGN